MNEKDKDDVVERALNDLLVRDIQECCLNGNFDAAENLAKMVMSDVDAKKLVKDLRKIMNESKA